MPQRDGDTSANGHSTTCSTRKFLEEELLLLLKSRGEIKSYKWQSLSNLLLKERYDLLLTEAQVNRIVDLVIPGLRRGRHDLTFNCVLTGSDKAKDFLVAFLMKRFELKKGPNAPLKHWEQYWAKADIFANAMKRPRVINQGPAGTLLSNQEDVNCSVLSATSGIMPSSSEPEPQSLLRLTDQQIITAVEWWFMDWVDGGYRRAICDEARLQVLCYPWLYRRPMAARKLRDLIQEARPAIEFHQSDDYINSHVDWLLSWMLALRADLKFIFEVIGCGYALAKNHAA